MDKNSFENNLFERFLNLLEKEISSKNFSNRLEESQKIDFNYYTKKVCISDLKEIIQKYKTLKNDENDLKKVQILLPGNPDIVFELCIEAIRYNTDFLIVIEDFCLAQNTILVEATKKVVEEMKIRNNIELKNMLSDSEIIDNAKKVDRTISIGNGNLYNRLKNKIDIILNTYGIFEIYSDSDEFEELQEIISEYLIQNQFEFEIFDDLNFEEAVKIINNQGYKFCTILFSNDKNKIEEFKNRMEAKYIVINKNPFKEIEFKLEIN